MLIPDTRSVDDFHQICQEAARQYGIELGNSSFEPSAQTLRYSVQSDEEFLNERGVERWGGEGKAATRFEEAIHAWWPKCVTICESRVQTVSP